MVGLSDTLVIIHAFPGPPLCTVRAMAMYRPSGDRTSAFQTVGARQPVAKRQAVMITSEIAARVAK
jgi:hypothetical protein